MRWQVYSSEFGLLARMFGWRRLAVALAGTIALTLLLLLHWPGDPRELVVETAAVGILALVVFGVLEFWPRHLPPWLPRWVLQLVGVVVAIPILLLVMYLAITPRGQPPFWQDQSRRFTFWALSISSLLLASVLALYAVVRQREADVRSQALAFDLERSEYERQALDARLRLLQAQVQPHFLFNTLANIRSLVEAGAPQATSVLDSLIDYLQAAVPRLHESATTLGQELQLVRAYLELMRMRIPDRLSFELRVDDSAEKLLCPPMTVLPLVENAVRHGIDPSEEGGRIEIDVRLRSNRCNVLVTDTGVGLQAVGRGLGTGLATLRERLGLAFDGDAELRVESLRPHGVRAQIDFPAKGAPS
jgi:two-component sensor histidine kinase